MRRFPLPVPAGRLAALVFAAAALGGAVPASAADAPGRKAWADVAPPVIVAVAPKPGDPGKLAVAFTLATGPDGADRAAVELRDGAGTLLETKAVGRTKSDAKSVDFSPPRSGTYSFRVSALRKDEEPKQSNIVSIDFSYPLAAPAFRILNAGSGTLELKWATVAEAEAYEIVWIDPASGATGRTGPIGARSAGIGPFPVGTRPAVSVAALRGSERAEAPTIARLVKAEADREWTFAWFGQSTKAELNTLSILDADAPTLRLSSCSLLPDGTIDQKGGKFTAFHDGVSFYYTAIDPKKENFSLSATFTIDYLNSVPDGQEGFGIVAMDSLGEHGVSGRNHYTNSAAVLATKFEETIGGIKRTGKDVLGARFVTGLTKEVLAGGDSAIAERGRSVSRAFGYERGDAVKTGGAYRLTLRKTNTGYHASIGDPAPDGTPPKEFVLYGPERLTALVADRIYVGFAVARGCVATVSDVDFRTSDPATDPPAVSEPPTLVPLSVKIDSPATATDAAYPLVFTANADGRLTIADARGAVLADREPVRANQDYRKTFTLAEGFNDFSLRFEPDPAYKPGPNAALAAWDRELQEYVESGAPVALNHSVLRSSYGLSELRVAPGGSVLGKGTAADPLDLPTALAFAKAGQPIVLAGGVYALDKPVVVGRGNDGTAAARKILRSAPGERAILDFRSAGGGVQLWGDFWTIEDIDVRNTGDNVKGFQIGGNDNVARNVATYRCGDTGLQISGNSAEPPSKWPARNLVERCVSFDNCDPAMNNADGFAAKLTCGEGNIFRGCLAYSNIDDGWDLFSKIESGPIGAVLIEDCVAYNNGSRLDGSGNGDGNGFKLGGDGIAVPHVLRNSVAFANGAAGITSNSDPAIVVERCTSFGNRGANVALYGKGDGRRTFRVAGLLSVGGGSADQWREAPELASASNYFWDGARSVNAAESRLGTEAFLSADAALLSRLPDGRIDTRGFLVPSASVPAGVGARLE
jgi:hypothetical protein